MSAAAVDSLDAIVASIAALPVNTRVNAGSADDYVSGEFEIRSLTQTEIEDLRHRAHTS